MRVKKSVAAAMVVVAMFAVTGVVLAQSPGDVMSACVNTSNRNVGKLVLNGTPNCNASETVYSWKVGEGLVPPAGGGSGGIGESVIEPFIGSVGVSNSGGGCWDATWGPLECDVTVATNYGFLLTPTAYPTDATMTFEGLMSSFGTGTGCFRLVGATSGTPLAGSDICAPAGTNERVVSSPIQTSALEEAYYVEGIVQGATPGTLTSFSLITSKIRLVAAA